MGFRLFEVKFGKQVRDCSGVGLDLSKIRASGCDRAGSRLLKGSDKVAIGKV